MPGSGAFEIVTVEVIGIKGCAVKGGTLPAVGKKCEIQLDWHGREVRLQAEVAWKNLYNRVGLKFLDVSDDQSAVLRGLCATLQLLPLVPTPQERHQDH